MISRGQDGKGFVLVVVLWVVLIAGGILLSVRQTARLNLIMAHNDLESVQAHWLARAGVEQAIALLEDDTTDSDSKADNWYDNSDSLGNVELSTGKFSVTAGADENGDPRQSRSGLEDLSGRLNVNVATEQQLAALPHVTAEQVNAILDWIDGDDDIRQGGAESGYYASLPLPYLIRNGPLQSLHELRLIKGIDDLTFYGNDKNLNGVLDANEDDGSGELHLGLAGLLTVYSYEFNRDGNGNKRVNLQTAQSDDLTQLGLSAAQAQAIMKQRPGKVSDLLVDSSSRGPQSASPSDGGNDSGGGPNGSDKITASWLAEHYDQLTTSDQDRLPARINVNTARTEVLMTLPEITAETALAIVSRRLSNQGAFGSVGELLSSNVLSEKQFKAVAEMVQGNRI